MSAIEHQLVISLLDSKNNQTGLALAQACTQTGCNILQARLNTLGEEQALALLVTGSWGAIAKLEVAIAQLEKNLKKSFQVKRTVVVDKQEGSWMSYAVQLIAIDRPALLKDITAFLNKQGVQIEELSAHTYLSPVGTRMVNINLKANIPEKIHLASFKEQIMAFCDEINVDVYLDPIRSFA